MNNIIGHTHIRSFFDRCISQGRLNHAYIFAGPRHVGKRTVAEMIARTILSITGSTCAHPDLVTLAREYDEKTGTRKKDISIAQIRELIGRFSQSAFVRGGYQIAIIDGAEYLNTAAANALLKTLEEPRAQTIVILVTEDESALLPTIRSRAQTVYFSPVPDSHIYDWLILQGTTPDRAVVMARDACGLPGYAVMWTHDEVVYTMYREEKERLRSLFSRSFHEKIETVEDFFADRDDHITARSRIIDIFRIWTIALREYLYDESGYGSSIPRILDTIRHAEHQLQKNVHPRLVVEHVLLSIP